MQWILLGGILLLNTFPAFAYWDCYLQQQLFFIITLPVEYDASNRALAWLENKRMLTQQEQAGQGRLKMGG
jgi:Zn-dependent membrane protease YugP